MDNIHAFPCAKQIDQTNDSHWCCVDCSPFLLGLFWCLGFLVWWFFSTLSEWFRGKLFWVAILLGMMLLVRILPFFFLIEEAQNCVITSKKEKKNKKGLLKKNNLTVGLFLWRWMIGNICDLDCFLWTLQSINKLLWSPCWLWFFQNPSLETHRHTTRETHE